MILSCVIISIFVAGSNSLKPKQSKACDIYRLFGSNLQWRGDGKINFIFELEK